MSDSAAADASSAPTGGTDTVTINVKAPSDVKLSLKVNLSSTVLELKQQIEKEKSEYAADSLRLIWSGRVLKDEETLTKYGLKDGNTIHLVKGNRAATNPATSSGPTSSAAAGVPSNVAAGQQFMGNPLAPLMNAQNAGALGGFNPFAEMGINPNDPNYMQTMMRDPAVQQQVNSLLQNPAVLDQIIQSNPQLSAMGPQVRQIMQSEQFRQFFTNPDSMNQMMQMMGSGSPFGGMGGMGGAAGGGGMPAPGGTAQGQQRSTGLYNPWGSTPSAGSGDNNSNNSSTASTGTDSATGGPTAGAFNPFAALGGAGGAAGGNGAMPDLQTMMQQLQQLQQLQQMFGSGTGPGMFGGAATGGSSASAPQQQQNQAPPEERYQASDLCFIDTESRNLRALMASGGNVEAAVEYLFSMP
ncbi:hypothetical protein OIO90_000644 [Microbotryomycetes sp. JL221]|nr:hypothetical protein OIO90_000644 [Microbotryomycetes sp. JL221]